MAQPPYPTNKVYGKGMEPSAPNAGMPGAAYGGQGMAPPPPPYYQQPGQQAYHYQPQQPKVQTSHGIFDSVAKSLSSVAAEATTLYSRNVHGDFMSLLQTGKTIALVSRMSGRSLEIVQLPDGRLTVDANGLDGPQVFNNKWTVSRLQLNVFLFSNYNNYLAMQGGQLTVLPGITDARAAPPTAHFKLSQSEHFILLESLAALGHYVSANERGEIKPPVATTNDKYAHFGVQFYN